MHLDSIDKTQKRICNLIGPDLSSRHQYVHRWYLDIKNLSAAPDCDLGLIMLLLKSLGLILIVYSFSLLTCENLFLTLFSKCQGNIVIFSVLDPSSFIVLTP